MDWIEIANSENKKERNILSYHDYYTLFERTPRQHARPSFVYLKDMFDFYGRDSEDHLNLFLQKDDETTPVHGQYDTQEQIYRNLVNFYEEGLNNKFILLVGPNGSSKSSLVKKMMRGLENYSQSEEGQLYTFSWVFPIDNFVKGTLGLNSSPTETSINTYAYLDDKDINAILNSELKDHPLLLIPRQYRQKLFDDFFQNDIDYLDAIKKTYLYRGDLSKRNKLIYDALLKNYKGNHFDVLKHIRVERFEISKRYSNGAVTIEPQLHVDARLQQITMDKRLASLPPSLQSLNLFSTQGEVVLANRGVLEFSDLLKRPLDTFKYLLQTMESGNINLQGILTELDIFFIGTSNEIHLTAFKQHPDFNSFKGRFNFIKVPYLLNYILEEKIYEDQVQGLSDNAQFAPHAIRALCMFAVFTRLRSPLAKHYQNNKLAKIVTTLTPLEKAQLLSEEFLPQRLDSESKQLLKQNIKEIRDEYINSNLYEGKFGISPREMKKIIFDLVAEYKSITYIEVLDFLEQLIEKRDEFDFLNMTPQGDYHHPGHFVNLLRDYSLDEFDKELRSCLGLVDNRSYEEYIKRYVENINAMIKGEKIKNAFSNRFEDPDQYFINEFEKNINLKEDPKTFRSHLISKLGAYYLDNPHTTIIYIDVFPNLVSRLQESFRNEQKQLIEIISNNLVYFTSELNDDGQSTPMSKEGRELITKVLNNLCKTFNYSQEAAISLLKELIKTKY
ncbi:MAG: hypothetical protein H6622_10900 [Halobacteriovoraceae bacterium]|nr:hypothetical protein [Halobacteriovoraceae bacterium]